MTVEPSRCDRGHPLTAANSYIAKRGDGRPFRRCRECERARDRKRRKGKPANNWSALPQSVRDSVRIPVLERDGYLCRIRGPKCTVVATEVDHIVKRKDGGALLDPSNCRASCEPCNRGRPDGEQPRRQSVVLGASREW